MKVPNVAINATKKSGTSNKKSEIEAAARQQSTGESFERKIQRSKVKTKQQEMNSRKCLLTDKNRSAVYINLREAEIQVNLQILGNLAAK